MQGKHPAGPRSEAPLTREQIYRPEYPPSTARVDRSAPSAHARPRETRPIEVRPTTGLVTRPGPERYEERPERTGSGRASGLPATPGEIRVSADDSFGDAFSIVLDALPAGWRFNRLFIAHADGGRNIPGAWYASASGPDPRRPGTQFGKTAGGRKGIVGAAFALESLARELNRLR